MGVDLVKSMLIHHGKRLRGQEAVVLTFMCTMALDRPNEKGQPSGLYFGGREVLAIMLGYDGLNPAAIQSVKRATKGLMDKGLIVPTTTARAGERQCYRLEVGLSRGSKLNPLWGSKDDPLWGTESDPLRGSKLDPPRTHSRTDEDLPEDIQLQPVTELQTARDLKRRKK